MTYEMKPIAGKQVLFVMAADAEYGVFLRTRISPLMTGVGPVEAAVVLTKELARLFSHDDLPDLVVSLGSAGSATLEQAEIYQVSAVSYRDMDASALGFTKGQTPFLDLAPVLPLGPLLPGLAGEAAVGLAILVVYFRNRRDISVENVDLMKG